MSTWHKTLDWLEQRINLSEIFSWITTFGISYAPLNSNLPLREVIREAFLKPLPSYQWPHVLGLLTFVTFLMELVTGLLLAFYYQPAAEVAYESTRLIIRDTSFGWYIHQMHYWGAHVMMALVILRLMRFLLHRVYRAPRELTWVFGYLVLAISVLSCLTGMLLPWNQESYWGTLRSLELMNGIPVLGTVLRYMVGGFVIDGFLLNRFYLLHIIFFPALLMAFFYLQFATVRKVGLTELEDTKESPVYPKHLMNLLILLLVLFGVILTLSMLFPASFPSQADPFSTPAGVSVPWFLLPTYGIFELFPSIVAGWVFFICFTALLVMPFIEPVLGRIMKKEWALKAAGLLFLFFVLYMTYLGYRRKG